MTSGSGLRPRVGLIIGYRNRNGELQQFECLHLYGGLAASRAAWRSQCQTCGAEFTITTPATTRAIRHRQGALWATRCREHAGIASKRPSR